MSSLVCELTFLVYFTLNIVSQIALLFLIKLCLCGAVNCFLTIVK